MYNWYGVLGIRSDASDEEINAGFLRTTTQLYPDRSATPDPRLRLVLRAYETLSNPAGRSTYDAALAGRYARIRQARRANAVTFATTFTLTLCCALATVLWRDQGSEAMAASSRAAEQAIFAFAAPREQGSDSSPQSRLLR